jgi:hypothetical protein
VSLVNSGNESVPIEVEVAGADPPTQFPDADQFGESAPPVHVKSVAAAGAAATATADNTAATTTAQPPTERRTKTPRFRR